MRVYVLGRVGQIIPVLFLASIATWSIVYLLPGSPASAIAGEGATPAQIAVIKRSLGLDSPIYVQYVIWLRDVVLHGNLGKSIIYGEPVGHLVLSRIPATLQLAIAAMIVGVALAIPLGVAAALRPGSIVDRVVRAYESLGIAVPTFWLGVLLVLGLSVWLKVLPSVSAYVPFWSNPGLAAKNLLLPAVTIGINVAAVLARFVTAAMFEVLSKDFIRTARGKGVAESRVIRVHALRNAMLPIVTVIGVQLASYLGGTLVTEVVFNYPGLGRLLYQAVLDRDYPTIQGALLVITLVFVLVNLIVDVAYAFINPQVRLR